jgi:hypothetical protein
MEERIGKRINAERTDEAFWQAHRARVERVARAAG